MQRQELERIAKYQFDNWETVDGYIGDIDVENNILRVGNQEFGLNSLSKEQAYSRLNIPGARKDFDNEADLPILKDSIAWAIGHKQKTKSRVIYDVNSMQAKAVKSERYNKIGNYRILEHAMSKFGDNFNADHSYIGDRHMYLSFSEIETRNIKAEIKNKTLDVGDEIGFGAQVWNSDVGLSSLSVGQFMLRLACTNGGISRDAINVERMIHTSANLFEKFTYAMGTVINPDYMVGIISRSMSRPAIIGEIENFGKIIKTIPERHHDGIIRAHHKEPIGVSPEGVNGWGIYNAVTRYNSHEYRTKDTFSPSESQRLLSSAYSLLTL